MTIAASIAHRYKRLRTLQTDRISTMPLVILMPHSACNCRCVMCDIWKDNANLKQLTEDDIAALLVSLKKLGTQRVLMSGGEALLNPNFFRFCKMLSKEKIKVSLLSTGLTLKKNAAEITEWVDEVIVSLDGPEIVHDKIRNIPGAWKKLQEGIKVLKSIDPQYKISARTVMHRLNFREWPDIISSAIEIGVNHISFLPADVSSHAFNREMLWSDQRQHEILLTEDEVDELRMITEKIISDFSREIDSSFIREDEDKLLKIPTYYAAFYGQNPFPYKRCNAPWVSAVVEADGTVRPCFFHAPMGNMRQHSLEEILNSDEAIQFRKELDIGTNPTCVKCVCSLQLPAGRKLN